MKQRETIRVRRRPSKGRSAKRRKRSKVLYRNEAAAVRSITKAIALHGEGEPIVEKCLDTMLRISRGENGYRGRYVGTRMRAIARIMDTLVGRPREAPPPPGSEDASRSAIVALVQGLRGNV